MATFPISKKDKQNRMVRPGIRDVGVLPGGSTDSIGNAGISLDYSAIQRGTGDDLPIAAFNAADDDYPGKDDIYDENGNVDIVKLWNSNPRAFEDEVRRMRTAGWFADDIIDSIEEKIRAVYPYNALNNKGYLNWNLIFELARDALGYANQADDIDAYNDHNRPGIGNFVGDKEEGYQLKMPLTANKKASIEVPYKCPKCDFKTNATSELSKHLSTTHKVKPDVMKAYITGEMDRREREIDELEKKEKLDKWRVFNQRKIVERDQRLESQTSMPTFDNDKLLTPIQIRHRLDSITSYLGYRYTAQRPQWYSVWADIMKSRGRFANVNLIAEMTIYPGQYKTERIDDWGEEIKTRETAYWTYDEAKEEAFPLLNEEIKKIPGILNFQIDEMPDGYAIGLSVQCKVPNEKNDIIEAFDDCDDMVKHSFPNLPQYSDLNRYTQNMEQPTATDTDVFDIFETYYADDSIEVKEKLLTAPAARKQLQEIADYFGYRVISWGEKYDHHNLPPYLIEGLFTPIIKEQSSLQGWPDENSAIEALELLKTELNKLPGVFDVIFGPNMKPNNYRIYFKMNLERQSYPHIRDNAETIEASDSTKSIKTAFPEYPSLQDSSIYEQVVERIDNNTTPQFDLLNTYWASNADDIIETKELLTCDEVNKLLQSIADYFGYELWTTPCEFGYSFISANFGANVKDSNADLTDLLMIWRDKESAQEALDLLSNELKDIPGFVEIKLNELEFRMGKPQLYGVNVLFNVIPYEEPTNITITRTPKTSMTKQAFVKTALTYPSNPIIQKLTSIPQIKALIEQHASGYVDEIKITTPATDIQQTQEKIKQDPNLSNVKLEQPSGSPYGHIFVYKDPTTHQPKALDRIARIDQITDEWNTLIVILHEISHARHPDWSESQVQTEAEQLAGKVKQYLTSKTASKQMMFFTSNLSMPIINCEVADTFSKQVMGLQKHSSLTPDSGMLFPYKQPSHLNFHMGQVSFPIDIIFADYNGQILKIDRNCKPGSQEIYSCSNASKVIEVMGSLCAFHDINVGDHIFDANDKKDFTKYVLEAIREIKIAEQKRLGMEKWNIRVVMTDDPDTRNFMIVDWTPKDYKLNKADIIINPNPKLIKAAIKDFKLDELVRHSLLHILAGYKKELPDDKEKELITSKMFKEAYNKQLSNLLDRYSTNKLH